ncbi:hypothetical protein VPH219E481_0049 [Vibrio phage 219E48-1]|nr:hypothetical protein PODOV021v1_p0037 [Vibrio phage 219E41.2]QZI91006.1 hypothetical protein PODOV032v1_p0001 [Vibrio phage 219E41.1]
MDITFDAQSVYISARTNSEVTIEASEIDLVMVLENFSAADILRHMDADTFLEEIGGDEVVGWATANGHIEED